MHIHPIDGSAASFEPEVEWMAVGCELRILELHLFFLPTKGQSGRD